MRLAFIRVLAMGVIDLFIKSIFCFLQNIVEFRYQGVEFLGVFLDGQSALRVELTALCYHFAKGAY
jgi:hypothetical protein